MKQILQDMSKGETFIVQAPAPKASKGTLLINTKCSLISVGTERMLVDFGRANLLYKAQQQPEKVKMVLEKIKTDGLLTTVDAVRSKLALPLPLGYCNVGIVHEVGSGEDQFKVGDRVISNGPHADVVKVGRNLCAKIPDNVTDQEAAFTVIASIGLQGIRLVNPSLGENIVVTGVGLIGLLTVQLLRAQGCRVLAIDYDKEKLALAKKFGALTCNPGCGEDPVAKGMELSQGRGVDAVIITASTKSSAPVSDAAKMSRKRGRIVLVGVAGLSLNRAEFYEKELTFQVSCSYGPGRYDANYEQKGQDYPYGFVRWTQQRNFEAILDMIAGGQLDVRSLISHQFNFEEAVQAYATLSADKGALGILLNYSSQPSERHQKTIALETNQINHSSSAPRIGLIGAGNYASRVLIPALKSTSAKMQMIATSGGVNAVVQGQKAGFLKATTDTPQLLQSSEVDTVIVATQHNTHAQFVIDALAAKKHVFVEKPLAINIEELERVKSQYSQSKNQSLMVGFNRRFAPHVVKMKELLQSTHGPKAFVMVMNAGAIPLSHWTQDIHVGGGRIIGEACHFIDLMRFLAGAKISSVQARRAKSEQADISTEDITSITLGFEDGSLGTIHYFANGHNAFPKERVEVFVDGKILQLDNFRKLKGYGWRNFNKMSFWRQDKGQKACVQAFIHSLSANQPSPISADEIFEVAQVSIEVALQLRQQ